MFFNPKAFVSKVFSFSLLLAVSVLIPFSSMAEGTRELAPNDDTVIPAEPDAGTVTTDIAALNIGNEEYNFFANLIIPMHPS